MIRCVGSSPDGRATGPRVLSERGPASPDTSFASRRKTEARRSPDLDEALISCGNHSDRGVPRQVEHYREGG
jgi:hypothetical protein